jgi:hypothetical protein
MDHFGYIPDNDRPKVPSLPPLTEFDRNWLLSRIEMILAGYRKADYHNLEAFLTQAAMILTTFPKEIIEYVSAPETGIQTQLQWPPSLAEIVAACVAEQTHREKVARYSAMGPTLPRLPKPKFSAEQSFEVMTAKHGRPTGVFETGREHPYGRA